MGIDAQMFVKTKHHYSEWEVRRLSVDLCEAFWREPFFLFEPGEYDDMPNGRHALEIITKYEQDGDDIIPKRGEQFIEVHLADRYYGKGYERGPIATHIAIAEWLERRIPDAQVFYGGDSSGVLAEPFGKLEREAIFAHFAKVGHRPYHGAFSSVFAKDHLPICGFCQYAMTACGGGRDREFYGCDGCGKKIVRLANGEIINVERGKDFFDVAKVS